jgi:hypothetical protein
MSHWVLNQEADYAYLSEDSRGEAAVFEWGDHKWDWEAHSSHPSGMVEDGNGLCESMEEAKHAAEAYLQKWATP